MTLEEAEAFVKAVYPESVVEPVSIFFDEPASIVDNDWWRTWSEKAGPGRRMLGHGSTVAEAWGDAAKRMAMRVAGGCPE